MKIQGTTPAQFFQNDALDGENLNADQLNPDKNGSPIADGPNGNPQRAPGTNRPDQSRDDIDRTARGMGAVIGTLLGNNMAKDSNDPLVYGTGAVLALPGKAEKAVFGFWGWLFGIIPLGIFDGIRELVGVKREKSYTREFTEGMLGIVGVDPNKKSTTIPTTTPQTPIEYELSFLDPNDPLRAEHERAKQWVDARSPVDPESELGYEHLSHAQNALQEVETKIREKSKAVQKRLEKLSPGLRNDQTTSETIRNEYLRRKTYLEDKLSKEKSPFFKQRIEKDLQGLEDWYKSMQKEMKLKDIYDRQREEWKGPKPSRITYDLPVDKKFSVLIPDPTSREQYAISSNAVSQQSAVTDVNLAAGNSVESQISATSAKPLSGIPRPVPLTYDLPVNSKISTLMVEPIAQKPIHVTSINSNAPSFQAVSQIQTLNVKPLSFDLQPVSSVQVQNVSLGSAPTSQSIASTGDSQPSTNQKLSLQTQNSQALLLQIQLKARGLIG